MSIGRPLPNYQCYIVDEHMQLLPPGALGELVLGGVSVSRRGYLNLPDKTATAFKPDTLGGTPFPLYRTGDLARFAPSGDIEYCGRADSQVGLDICLHMVSGQCHGELGLLGAATWVEAGGTSE
jgi:non-ribosomal peptide synthetase component F